MREYRKKAQHSFTLPILILIGTALIAVGVSSLIANTSIARTLQNQHWHRIANDAAQAGVAFATDCLKNKTNYWTNTLKPNSTCSGTTKADTALAQGDGWTSTFSVSTPNNNGSTTATATGTVTLIATGRTYTAQNVVIVNIEGGLSAKKVAFSSASSYTAYHTCILASNNQVYCAGANSSGQLGNGNTTSQSTPVKFNLPSGLTAADVDLGNGHTCVLASDNQVYCAGANSYGQLGNGNMTNQSTPVKFNLSSGLTAVQLTADKFNTCAVASNGRIYCAGEGANYRLGNGNTTNQSTPVLFNSFVGGEFSAAINVTIGSNIICAAGNDAEIVGWAWTYCAGYNGYGALGIGNYTQPTTPGPWGGSGFQSSTGEQRGDNTCGIGLNGIVHCSGSNSYGQHGDGTTTSTNSPVQFGPGMGVYALVPFQGGNNALHTCVIRTTGNMHCAGYNTYGQLGNGNTTNQSTPVLFNAPTRAVKGAVSSMYTTCAIAVRNNQVYCAGYNNYGQLGNGNTTNQSTPAKFNLPTNLVAKEVTTTTYNTCVIASNRQAYCAGYNNYGQLGNGNTANQSTPVKFQLP